jgi:glycosyltransferase involved in cell wall biosynthesis
VEVIHFRTVPESLPGNWIDASRFIRLRVRESRPDLVIVGKSYQYVPLLRLSSLSRKVPVLYLMHHLEWMDSGNRFKSGLYRRYVRWLLGMADMIWANSVNTSSALLAMGFPEDRVRVINPGFHRPENPLPDRKGRSGPVRLLCVGSVSRRKAQDVLLGACRLLEEEDFILEMAGSTSSEPSFTRKVEELIGTLDLDSRVRLLGSLDGETLTQAYERADILVHPAVWEAFGISILEGMWQGLPVVASDVAAVPELVHDGRNGLLVKPGSAEALADALRILIRNEDMRLEMGSKSRRLASGRNDWRQTGEEFLELVRETMASADQRGD